MFLKKFSQVVKNCHRKISTKKNLSNEWKSVIGLEIHAQLATKSKLFSSAPAVFGAPANQATALFDAAIPGTLPSLNKNAVELAVITALALGCKVNPVSLFDRKHYFYSDLPAGYQITQQRLPIAQNGKLEYAIYQPGLHKEPYFKTSFIKQIQLEQDSGKSLHEINERQCYIDLNRAGSALVEIVFEPDIDDENEAAALVKEVIRVLERLGACSGKMEEASLRVDANVSVHKEGEGLGVRTEIKNLGSVTAVLNSIKAEVSRQVEILNNGGSVKNETLNWDAEKRELIHLREKKEDYRFMPEPNLPPLRLLVDPYSENFHKSVKKSNPILDVRHLVGKLPRLPQDDRILLAEKYFLSKDFAFNLVNQEKLLNYFKEIMEEDPSRNPKALYQLLMVKVLWALEEKKIKLDDCVIPTSYLAELLDLRENRIISKRTCDEVLKIIVSQDKLSPPLEIIEKNNWFMISNPKELKKICLRVIGKEQSAVAAYKKNRKKLILNSLVHKAVEESNFRADTELLPDIMSELLHNPDNET